MDTDKGDRILMCTFNHFIQAPNVYSRGQMALKYMDRGHHKAIWSRTLSERCAPCTRTCMCVGEHSLFTYQGGLTVISFPGVAPVINKYQRESEVACSWEMQMKATCCVVETTLFFLTWHGSIRFPAFFTLCSPGVFLPEIDGGEETSRCCEINVVI